MNQSFIVQRLNPHGFTIHKNLSITNIVDFAADQYQGQR